MIKKNSVLFFFSKKRRDYEFLAVFVGSECVLEDRKEMPPNDKFRRLRVLRPKLKLQDFKR